MLFTKQVLFFSLYLGFVTSQQPGNLEQEGNPTITLKECTNAGGCTSKQAKLVLDANWRWIHQKDGYNNCYTGDQWSSQYCTDPVQCANNCALEGVSSDKYRNTYGVEQLSNGVKLNFVTNHQYGTNVGSRLYVMDGDDKYKLFYLKNREFSMDFDVSHLFCGMNGAMYFVEMDEYGGKGQGQNQAGAKYGTGYCDAQCPHDIKFITGEANVIDWKPNENDKSNNMGSGKYGSCCAEMDIWEANSMATAYTPHTCDLGENVGQLRCEGIACGDNDKGERYQGVCDKDGCDINPYRMGNQMFYGRGDDYTVNTLKPMTVVTQFLTDDGTDDGDLVEIRRFYVQDGKVIHSPASTILGPNDSDSLTDDFCAAKKDLFGDINDYKLKGGNKGMGDSLDRGQVLTISLWDDVEVNMLWLDSAYPLDKPVTDPGIKRGECPGGESSTPTYLRENYPDGYVVFENAAIGEIGSTVKVPDTPSKSPTNPPTLSPTDAPLICQSWCFDNTKPWQTKCSWLKCNGCEPCKSSVTSSPTYSPTKPPSSVPTSSPTATTLSPTSTDNDYCCTWDFYNCGSDEWCNENETNCQGSCGGAWLKKSSDAMKCLAKWQECTSDPNACCAPTICKGNENYKQCLDA
jgi:cellulose 1,4-beta-cellobiosidase